MNYLTSFAAGLIFGLGLLISGMDYPAKVLSFLDLTRPWDPSLALVMGAALAVAAPAFFWARRRGRTLGGAALDLPSKTAIDARLIGGSLLFGLGWGLAGICPGPALANLGFLSLPALIFVLAMAVGLKFVALLDR